MSQIKYTYRDTSHIITCLGFPPADYSGLFSGVVNGNQVSVAMKRFATVCSIRPVKTTNFRQVATVDFTDVTEG